MRMRLARCVLTALVLGPVTGHRSLAAQQAPATSVTLYQDGRVLLRRAFAQRLPAGPSVQRIPLGPVDAASLFSLDSDVVLNGATTLPGADADQALRGLVGKRILFRSGTAFRDTVSATLVGTDPYRVQFADGSVLWGLPGTPTFPAEVTPGDPVTELRLQARRAGDVLRLGGFAQGGQWRAMYTVILRGATAGVTGLASFAVPFAAEGAEVQLLAGQVNQAPMAGMRPRPMAAARAQAFDAAKESAGEEGVGTFHLYTLPGRFSLRPGTVTSAALFDPASAPVARTFEVGSSVPLMGYWPQTGDEDEVPVQVYYTLTRARRTAFGDAPLPAGTVRLFEADSAGRLQLIGEAGTGHTAPGEELRVNAGTAFDLVARRIQTDYQTGQEPVPGAPRRTRTYVSAAYADTLRNQGEAEATIDVLVERQGEWRIVESSRPAERLSSTRARFRVKVPARGEAVVTYRIRASW
jgi:hypothetical protein